MASSARKKRASPGSRRKAAPRKLSRRVAEFFSDLPLPRLGLVPVIGAAVCILLLALLLLRGMPMPATVTMPPAVVTAPGSKPDKAVETPPPQAEAPEAAKPEAPAPEVQPQPPPAEPPAELPSQPVPPPATEPALPAVKPQPAPTPEPLPEPKPAAKPAPRPDPGNRLPGPAPSVPAGKAPSPEVTPSFGPNRPLPSQGPVPAPAPPAPRASMPQPVVPPAPAIAAAPPPAKLATAAVPPKAAARTPVEAPAWERHALAAPAPSERPRIVLVIDDMGLDRPRSARAVALPGPLTLSWLPYARDLPEQTRAARARGHELMVHVPMEPFGRMDPGPDALTVKLGAAEIRRRLAEDLKAFDGYVGINNHMGSRFTADATGMAEVMAMLGQRGLLFLDSRTTPQSKAPDLAARYGVPLLSRDVFLDHDMAAPAVEKQLAHVETIARHNGIAIAIGHPHDATLKALARWLPTLEAKGFQLVPLSAAARAGL